MSYNGMYYTGRSMNPLLKGGDMLEVVPYGERPAVCGDVIVFRPPGRDGFVTHRVIAIHGAVITSRGDNNLHADNWAVSKEIIAGMVTHAERQGRRRRVQGGAAGLAYAYLLHAMGKADLLLCFSTRRAYRALSQSGILRRWLPALNFRVISIKRPEGTELKLMLGKTVIGRLLPQGRSWQIRRPFRLLVDEATLPASSDVTTATI